ncbi:hypothetical protein [Spiroplasma monobiae]|uniref:Uncharacterized protein n=1 Tax=Spiroplasma monobiae MQ-1 TaxID=1336748 RepID=A0A2K9LTP6_SPISQ|nr:hypothetical protein [Spiroplasma monobiae]AUM62380.1 hypothetical protein SMONO_v1c01290 [Spiroplasma monobiae MQ-1]
MKKNLSLIAYISLALALLNQIFVISFAKLIFKKVNKVELDEMSYIIIIIAVIFLTIIGIIATLFIFKNTVKSSFVGSIILITLGVMLLPTIFGFTWIFGVINIICGILMITVGAIHLKTSREYL